MIYISDSDAKKILELLEKISNQLSKNNSKSVLKYKQGTLTHDMANDIPDIIRGLDFAPAVVLFWAGRNNTNQFTWASFSKDRGTSFNANGIFYNGNFGMAGSIRCQYPTLNDVFQGYIASWNEDGFTMNYTRLNNPGEILAMDWLALG